VQEVIDRESQLAPHLLLPGTVEVDEAAARQSLHRQIAKLESELSSLFCTAYPRQGFEWQVGSRRAGRILSLGQLEEVRDRLIARLRENREAFAERSQVEDQKRRLIEEMMLDPAAHRWERVSNAEIGEPGCHHWHVRPRRGLIGLLRGWWHVVISSGCPLAMGACGPRPMDRLTTPITADG